MPREGRRSRVARSNAVERVAHLFTEEEKLQASVSARNLSMRGSHAEEEKRQRVGAEALPTSENQVLHYRATTMLTHEDMPRNMNTDIRVTEGPLSRATGTRSRDILSKRHEVSLISQARESPVRELHSRYIEEDKLEEVASVDYGRGAVTGQSAARGVVGASGGEPFLNLSNMMQWASREENPSGAAGG